MGSKAWDLSKAINGKLVGINANTIEDNDVETLKNKISDVVTEKIKPQLDVVQETAKQLVNTNIPIHSEQDIEPDVSNAKPGDTWWDTKNNVLYMCVTGNNGKMWLQIS
jgi:hypothetical protein